MTELIRKLRVKFADKEYRQAYAESFLDSLIATQLKTLREQRGLTQEQLAQLAEMRQSRISALENVNYSSWSIKTLKKLARALDVVLSVRFISFGQLMSEAENFSKQALRVPSFEEDLRLTNQRAQASAYTITIKNATFAGISGGAILTPEYARVFYGFRLEAALSSTLSTTFSNQSGAVPFLDPVSQGFPMAPTSEAA